MMENPEGIPFRFLNVDVSQIFIKKIDMANVNSLKNELVEKILSIQNIEFLQALNVLISNSEKKFKEKKLVSDAEKEILLKSKEDINAGRFVSQDVLYQKSLEWLNDK